MSVISMSDTIVHMSVALAKLTVDHFMYYTVLYHHTACVNITIW